MITKVYSHLLKECFNLLPISVSSNEAQFSIEVDLTELSQLYWKRKKLDPKHLPNTLLSELTGLPGLEIAEGKFLIPQKLSVHDFSQILDALTTLSARISEENLKEKELWGKLNKVIPTGFENEDLKSSRVLLDELYENNFIVSEKKPLIVDLLKSSGNYLVSIPPKRRALIDGASQIASLAVGFNDIATRPMALRAELWDPDFDPKDWDVKQAFEKIILKASDFSHINFLNSGAEAIEAAFRACQIKHPERRKIIAFEGSFHGRMLLALHTTHSPAKREPFEIYKDLVEFNPFPENKNPKTKISEPDSWLNAWADTNDENFQALVDEFQKNKDQLLHREIHCLLHMRSLLKKEKKLCVIIEPLQCEGGDRYGSNRFYRALRVLTRAFDAPLIFDEVQTGFGLGGSLFWHQSFHLETPDGKPEKPDIVCVAKKAQVAFIASDIKQDLPLETSPASFYRGYLYARRVMQFDAFQMEEKINAQMKILQDVLDEELIQSPRGQGLAFAFDLPNKEILAGLIANRYKNGLMFYPAGEKTARFRVTTSTTDREIVHIFKSIYQCFLSVSEEKKIWKIPSLDEWIAKQPSEFQAYAKEAPEIPFELPWAETWIPNTFEDFETTGCETWQKIFELLVNEFPQILRSKASIEFDLKKLNGFSKSGLWRYYETHVEFTLLDLIFQGSRAFGIKMDCLQSNEVESQIDWIMKIQENVYEPERIDPKERILKFTQDPKSFVLIAKDPESEALIGFNTAVPMKYFSHVGFVANDPYKDDPHSLYSMDQSVAPAWHGKGLGLRLKAEQFMEAMRQGTTTLRSRNKTPESDAMAHINQKLSSVEIDRGDKQYSGKGVAAYQSFVCNDPSNPAKYQIPYQSVKLGSLRNKITLSNFIGQSMANDLLTIKEILPNNLKHAYIASGRAEAADKCVRMFRSKRKYAKTALSIRGDYFGETSASVRSLGGSPHPLQFFDWPVLGLDEVEKYLSDQNPDQILALFVEPMSEKTGIKKDPKDLKKLIQVCHSKKVPVVFHETASMFYRYHDQDFFCANDEIQPDAIYFYGGGQFGFVAVNEKSFVDKPLQLISTWDGDEHSMNLFREKVIQALCKKSS